MVQRHTLFESATDGLDLRKIFNGIAGQREKAGFVSLHKPSDFSFRENGSRGGFAPHLEQREVVEQMQRAQVQYFGQRRVGMVAADDQSDTRPMEQSEIILQHLPYRITRQQCVMFSRL